MFPLRWLVLALAAALATSCASEKLPGCRGALCAPSDSDAGTAGAGCASDADCGPTAPRCELESRRCVVCRSDADCGTGTCRDNACLPLPDGCATATVVTLPDQGSIEISGDTTKALNDARAPCAYASGNAGDLVYRLSLKWRRRVVAVARRASGSALRPLLWLKSSCDPAEPETAFGCGWLATNSDEAHLSADLPAGEYYLWIDGDGDSAGAFTLKLSTDVAPPGDSCGAPEEVLPFTSEVTLTGDTSEFTNDAAGTCGGLASPDRVYALELVQPQRLRAELTALDGGYYPVVYVRRGSCDGTDSQLACGRAPTVGPASVAVVDVPRAEAGDYFVFVDGTSATTGVSSGPYRLRLSLSAPLSTPPNDACDSESPLTLGMGQASASGDTTSATNDTYGTCGGTGPDVVFRLTLQQTAQVSLRATATGGTLRPMLYVRRPGQCGSTASADQLGCAIAPPGSSTAALLLPQLLPGDYHVWVDGYGGTKGAFTLTAEATAPAQPVASDSCSTSQAVSLASGAVTLSGSTSGAKDDAYSCEVGGTAPDVVYTVEVPAQGSLSVDLRAMPGSPLRPVMYLRKPGACASTALADEVFCAYGDPQIPDRAVYVVPSLPAGAYALWVDGDYATHGPFSLRVGFGAAIAQPANEHCNSLQLPLLPLLPLGGAATTGDTRGATNDAKGACGGPIGSNGEDAPDVVYRFSLVSPQTVTVTVTPDVADGQLFRPVVYVRGPGSLACSSTAAADQKGCATASGYGGTASLTLANLPTGTYYLWVDGAGQSAGRFTVKLQ